MPYDSLNQLVTDSIQDIQSVVWDAEGGPDAEGISYNHLTKSVTCNQLIQMGNGQSILVIVVSFAFGSLDYIFKCKSIMK